jgi:hypothetical protein
MPPGDDRALQDALIRLLADAPFRDAVERLERGQAYGDVPARHVEALKSADPERVRRFARFLARGFYYERIVHFYKYSRALARWTHRPPEAVLRTGDFEALFPSIILGSRTTAHDVARLIQRHLADSPAAPPYAADLLRYESAQMIAEAGPRVWHSNDVPAPLTPSSVVALNPYATVLHFGWDLPAVLGGLLAAARLEALPPSPPEATRRQITLLFARSPRGRVTVMRWNPVLEMLANTLDGAHDLASAAGAAGIPTSDGVEIVAALVEAGVAELRRASSAMHPPSTKATARA